MSFDEQSQRFRRAERTLQSWLRTDVPRAERILATEPELLRRLRYVAERARSGLGQAQAAATDARRGRRERPEAAGTLMKAAADAAHQIAQRVLRDTQRLMREAQAQGIALDLALGRYERAAQRVTREARGAARNLGDAASSLGSGLGLLLGAAALLMFASKSKGR